MFDQTNCEMIARTSAHLLVSLVRTESRWSGGGLILYPGVSVMGGPLAVDFQYHCIVLYCIVQSSGMKP